MALIHLVKSEEEGEIEGYGWCKRVQMRMRRGRMWYKGKMSDFWHRFVITTLYVGMATVAVVREIRSSSTEVEVWQKVLNGCLMGLSALIGGVSMVFRYQFSRGYPISFPQSFLSAQMLIS